MSVPIQDPESLHVGNGVSTVFAYGFLLLAPTDLQVYVDDALKTLDLDYTVSGIGADGGGNVTFSAAPADGASVMLLRKVPLLRDTSYQYSGDFQSKTVNPDFDRIWMALQDFLARFTSAIRFPRGENLLNSILPRAALRARKALVFNPDGSVSVSVDDYNDQAANAAASAEAAEQAAIEADSARDQVIELLSHLAEFERHDRVAIIGNFGQSNGSGRAQPMSMTGDPRTGYDTTRVDVPDPRVLTFSHPDTMNSGLWNSDGGASGAYINRITMAVEPLYHADGAHGLGHGTTFAKGLLNSGYPVSKVLLVPASYGGTGMAVAPFPPTSWGVGNPGSDLYENAISRMFAAAAECERLGLDWYFAGIVWHQGENNRNLTPAVFAELQDAIFAGFRSRLGVPDLPIIAGSFIYESLFDPTYLNMAGNRLAVIDTARRMEHTSFFYGPGPGYQVNNAVDFLHFNADGQRMLGTDAVNAFYIALANRVGMQPIRPPSLKVRQVGSAVHAWWTRPVSRVTNYELQVSRQGSFAWAPIPLAGILDPERSVDCGQADLPAAVWNDADLGNVYHFRVRAQNESGLSAWTSQTIATVPVPAPVAFVTVLGTTSTTMSLSWPASPLTDIYSVEYSDDAGATWKLANAAIKGTSYTVTALDPLVTYQARVTSANSAGSSAPTVSASATTTAAAILHSALSGAAQAAVWGYYSVSRRLIDSYTGALLRVRRTSDNTEQDIGQTAAKTLDVGALSSFLAGADGYITKVYDQSGNGRDVGQANAANQPRFAVGGQVTRVDNRPAADQSMDALRVLENTTTGLYAAGKATMFAPIVATGPGAVLMECASAAGNPRYAPISVGTGGQVLSRIIINDASTTIDTSNTNPQVAVHTGYHAVGVVDSGASLLVRQDGKTTETKAYTRSGSFTVNRFCLFGAHNGSTFSGMTGFWGEAVVFSDAIAAPDYQAIEASMAMWFGTKKWIAHE